MEVQGIMSRCVYVYTDGQRCKTKCQKRERCWKHASTQQKLQCRFCPKYTASILNTCHKCQSKHWRQLRREKDFREVMDWLFEGTPIP